LISQKKQALGLGIVIIGIILIPPEVPAANSKGPNIPDDVKQTIRFRVDNGYNIGIVAGIVSPEGRQYYSYGKTALSENKKIDKKTVFEIGSVTKVFTALLLAQMAAQNEVSLNEPIEKYLPKSVKVPKHNDLSITLAHLSTHSSALPRLPDNMRPAELNNPYDDYSAEQMYEFLSAHTLRRDIGTQYEYSNYGFGLLGHILALRGGKSYEELLKERILDVLNMTDTGITLKAEMKNHFAQGHSGSREVSNWDFTSMAGAGALRSSAQDLLRFLAANLGLEKTRLYPAIKTTHKPRHEATTQLHIALGWHIVSSEKRKLFVHDGGTGGYWAFIGFNPDNKKGVVLLTNSNQSISDIGLHLLDANFPISEMEPAGAANYAETVPIEMVIGQNLPTGKEVIEDFIKAIGGRDALAKLKNRHIKATVEMRQLGFKGTMTAYQARPNKCYSKMDFGSFWIIERGTDGQVVWELDSMGGPRIVEAQERSLMLLFYEFDPTNYEKLYEKIECVGLVEIAAQICYEVKLTPRQCMPYTSYFSRVSGLQVKQVFTLPSSIGPIPIEEFMNDCRQVDGIRVPHRTIQHAMNMDTYITIESIEHNVEIPQGRFEPPEEITKLLESSKEKESVSEK